MKYRDIVTVIIGIFSFLSLAYTLGVEPSTWPLTFILFIVFILVIYVLWLKK
jgi:hypothetical protein